MDSLERIKLFVATHEKEQFRRNWFTRINQLSVALLHIKERTQTFYNSTKFSNITAFFQLLPSTADLLCTLNHTAYRSAFSCTVPTARPGATTPLTCFRVKHIYPLAQTERCSGWFLSPLIHYLVQFECEIAELFTLLHARTHRGQPVNVIAFDKLSKQKSSARRK